VCGDGLCVLRQPRGAFTELNRMRPVLFDMNNRAFGPCFAVIYRMLISVLRHIAVHFPFDQGGLSVHPRL
jgi:hypothetical protein